jgi:hypothetical protein
VRRCCDSGRSLETADQANFARIAILAEAKSLTVAFCRTDNGGTGGTYLPCKARFEGIGIAGADFAALLGTERRDDNTSRSKLHGRQRANR